MFRRLRESAETVLLCVDGRAVAAAAGDTVAAALLAAGIGDFRRSPVSGAPRGPYCGMGACFECLVSIDGEGAVQACLTPVRDGMIVETGAGRRHLAAEGGG